MIERRKGYMINNLLQTLTSATFLLLASLLIYDRWQSNNNTASIEALRRELQDQGIKNVYYLEERQNAISVRQDSYQSNVNRRLDVLEQRMESLEIMRRVSGRTINTNTNVLNK